MIGPKQTTNEQIGNETKPTVDHESSHRVQEKRIEENGDVTSRRGNLLDDAGKVG